MKLISFLKKFPIDLGQAEKKHYTAGKKIAFSFVGDGQGKTALDIGARDGYWSEQLKKKGYKVVSLDIEPYYQGTIKCNVEEGIPCDDKTIDLIWCTEVIEHLHNPSFLLKEINRVLTPTGKAILTTPNSDWWFYKISKLWGWTPKKLQNPDHKQFFKEKTIRNIASGYDLYGYFPYALFFLRIKRMIGFLSPTFIFVRRK
ncbi:MAG: hypothetical protein RJA61_571 [Candidatus Parcubacteria bacterium]|jgi:2-polyprenyl-3-methyl-5-hydroxy-6-metoxy-1,4-benzoquinol methylase